MLNVDTRALLRMDKDLEVYAERAKPYAVRNGLNRIAFRAREVWQGKVEDTLVLRNAFTKRSILVDKAKGLDVARMQSVTGTIAPYLLSQEEGVTKGRGGSSVAIPTSVASGEGRGAQPRRKIVRRPNRLANIELERARGRLSKRQRNAVEIKKAARSGRRYVYLELRDRKGIFRLRGSLKKPKLDMVWDLSRSSVRVPARPTLGPTLESIEPEVLKTYARALEEQLVRHKVFGY